MPQLTSVRPPFGQIVTESLRLLANGTAMPTRVALTPQLIVRESSVNRR